jgi:hypothetical protein
VYPQTACAARAGPESRVAGSGGSQFTAELVRISLPRCGPFAPDWYRRSGLLAPGEKPPSLAVVLARPGEQALICAHSHIAWVQEAAGRMVVNPGAVGGSDNGDVGGQYAGTEWHADRWKAFLGYVPYDLTQVREAFQKSGLLEPDCVMAEAFLLDILSAREIPGWFTRHAGRVAARAGFETGGRIQYEVRQEAVATFEWGDHADGRYGGL